SPEEPASPLLFRPSSFHRHGSLARKYFQDPAAFPNGKISEIRLTPHLAQYTYRPHSTKNIIKVDLVIDFPPRLTPALRVGKVWIDSLEDILANKIGCLVSRSEMKDYVDLYYLIPASGLSTGQIIELGTKKEAGLDPLILAHQIDFIFLEKAPPAELVVKADRQKIQLFFKKLQQECFDLIRP
ncbi:MAG TPA: hypothetical protein DF383_11340, partial [Deltaproteobacteria bacterium]|nr:hypothetical protein [Deltaproteobacteria bacterium]